MKDNKISFRKEDEKKNPLLLSMVHNILNELEKVKYQDERSLFDIPTIQTIRQSLALLDGWEEVYLNVAFQKGVDVGTNPNRPDGLLSKDVYCYTDDFFFSVNSDEKDK